MSADFCRFPDKYRVPSRTNRIRVYIRGAGEMRLSVMQVDKEECLCGAGIGSL